MAKITRKAIETTIIKCLKNKDPTTARNYYENYKERFKDLDIDKLKKEAEKPNKPKEENKPIKEDKED
jgi:hypothetical protein